MDHFYDVNRHDIKYTITNNIDVEHISTTSVLFNYFLLLFNYYASILFADLQFFPHNRTSLFAEVKYAAHHRGLQSHQPELGYGPCCSCLKWFLLCRIEILLYIFAAVHLKEDLA